MLSRGFVARRMRGVVTTLAVSMMLLTGCASIPMSGPVNEGIALESEGSVDVDIVARGPQPGDTPEQIVTGFVSAAASPQLDYRVAREFLTRNFSREWNPDSGTTVDRVATRGVPFVSGSEVNLTIRPVAEVTSSGVYTEINSPAAASLDYQLEKVDGEWRIKSAPQGIVIDETTFGIVYRAHNLYFFSPDSAFLVPDVRWFARRESTQTSVVRALIDGPREWLAPGVVTAVPAGMTLDSDAVPVSNGRATVALSTDAPVDPVTLARIQAQIQASLSTVTTLVAVTLVLNGTVETTTALNPAPLTAPRVDSRAAILSNDKFGYVSAISGEVEPIPGLSEQIVASSPLAVTLGVNAALAAAQTADGIARVNEKGFDLVLEGREWIAPTLDPANRLWSAQDSTRVSWVASDGNAGEISTGWGEAEIRALAMSRDGTRIVAALQSGALTRVVGSAVERNESGSPIGLGQPLVIAEIDGNARSLAWIDPTRLALLTSETANADEMATLTTVEVGGTSRFETVPSASVSIAAGNTERELRIVTASGDLLARSGATWQTRLSGVSLLATQTGAR